MINHELWCAIYEYVRACGGDPTLGRLSSRPLVPEIERIVRMYRSGAWLEGVDDAVEGIPGGEEYASAINRHVNAIVNPYEEKKP